MACMAALAGAVRALPPEATITLSPAVVGKTPTLVGYGQGHYVPGSNTSQWLARSGANCLRLWVNAAHFAPEAPPAGYGDGVTDLASFEARRAAVIADPEGGKTIDWAYYDKRFRDVRTPGRNVYNLHFALTELKRLGIRPLVLTAHCAPSGVTAKTDPRDWRNVRHRPAWMPISIAGSWADKWEFWKWHFLSAYWMARHHGVTDFQIWNEPDHIEIGANIRQDDYIEWLRFGSDAKRAAVRAVNTRYKRALVARIYGPVITSPRAFFARRENADTRDDTTGWGEAVCRSLRTDYAGRTVDYNLVDVFDTHRYNPDAARYDAEIRQMQEGMAKFSPGGVVLPINYSEQNVESTRGFDQTRHDLDLPALFCAQARILATFARRGVYGVQAFKYSDVGGKNVGFHRTNEGPTNWDTTGRRRAADVLRLFAKGFSGGRDRIEAAGGEDASVVAASDAGNYYLWSVNARPSSPLPLRIDASRLTDRAGPAAVEEVSAARRGEPGEPAAFDAAGSLRLTQPPQSVWLITIPRRRTGAAPKTATPGR